MIRVGVVRSAVRSRQTNATCSGELAWRCSTAGGRPERDGLAGPRGYR